MRIEEKLKQVLLDDMSLREVEPQILSIYPEDESAGYDEFGGIYETVACNRFYNRLSGGIGYRNIRPCVLMFYSHQRMNGFWTQDADHWHLR